MHLQNCICGFQKSKLWIGSVQMPFALMQTVIEVRSFFWAAAIAPWYCLRLPSCGDGFKSQSTPSVLFSICIIEIVMRKDENKQKEAGIGQFLKISFF